jgi:pimeloyl-ACP methyl ester carboxylesterase
VILSGQRTRVSTRSMTAERTDTAPMQATITAHGLKLFVREQGSGHPLLMINGLGTSSEMWGNAERILAGSSRTIVFDCPGTGRSETPLLPRSLPALARIVQALLDELGHDQVDVLGFSFGGALAQQLAKDSPDRIRRLALVSTFCGWGGTPGNLELGDRAAPYRPDLSGSLGSSYQLWALVGWSSLPWLCRVRTPTLVLAGGRDRLVPPENAVQLARQLPNSSLHLLPDAEHLDMFDEERGGARLLADFFASASLEDSTAWPLGLPV